VFDQQNKEEKKREAVNKADEAAGLSAFDRELFWKMVEGEKRRILLEEMLEAEMDLLKKFDDTALKAIARHCRHVKPDEWIVDPYACGRLVDADRQKLIEIMAERAVAREQSRAGGSADAYHDSIAEMQAQIAHLQVTAAEQQQAMTKEKKAEEVDYELGGAMLEAFEQDKETACIDLWLIFARDRGLRPVNDRCFIDDTGMNLAHFAARRCFPNIMQKMADASRDYSHDTWGFLVNSSTNPLKIPVSWTPIMCRADPAHSHFDEENFTAVQ
jgi:hypothetical protein